MKSKPFDDDKRYDLQSLYHRTCTSMDKVSEFVVKNCDENGAMHDDITKEDISAALNESISVRAISELFFAHLTSFTSGMEEPLKNSLIKFFKSSGDYAQSFSYQATIWMAAHGIELNFEV